MFEFAANVKVRVARRCVSIVALLLVTLCAANVARANTTQQSGDEAQTSASAASQALAANHAGPGMDIAFADFDGDLRPDTAQVERGNAAAGGENYSIDFRFSSNEAPASMSVVAPRGGLRIEARDVNGDSAMDLVVTTAWFREPVAILLNDGHGKFSHAAPTAYPNAFQHPASTFNASFSDPFIPFAITTPQSDFVLATAQASQLVLAPASRGVVSPSIGFRAGPFNRASAGRAPPASL
jgi:hypothetical protein